MNPTDFSERQQALDYTKSFIVQAPAGSGKTELLTQRFLTLLANATTNPEEIVAITFTRKAAAEMRQRIISAITLAQTASKPTETHKQNTWLLAKKVLQKDQQFQWHILENPNRLKVTTIDAFCRSIVGQLPILSHMGSQTNITDNSYRLYHKAAQATLKHLTQDDPWYNALKTLLISVDNDYERAESLIVAMLSTREQWLNYIGIPEDMAVNHLSQSLANIITQTLENIYENMSALIDEERILSLVRYANTNLSSSMPIYLSLPEPNVEHIVFWTFLANLLITKEGKRRKTVNKSHGFPATSEFKNAEEKKIATSMKAAMKEILTLIDNDNDLISALASLIAMPDISYYEDTQKKEKIFSLFQVMELAYAELRLIFRHVNQVDFTEVSLSANSALQNVENISEINLILDYKLKHILIDEFQDTSRLQFSLLESLTKEWQPDDAKTLFLVGDPMQSIYRFRQAEVGLFIQVQQIGINHLAITPLKLSCNFRSEKSIIDWVNQQFEHAFPQKSDIASGAIHYSFATPIHSDSHHNKAISWHIYEQSSDEETRAINTAKIIHKILDEDPHASIAILARKRKHLLAMIQALNIFKINYQAVDIESLTQKPLIHDLIALTAAFKHLGDKLSWLSLLRSPIIALELKDLLIIAEQAKNKTVHQVLNTQETIQQLSLTGQQSLQRAMPIINFVINERERFSLRQLVEHSWKVLGGEETFQHQSEKNQFNSFLSLLEYWDDETVDFHTLRNALESKYANTEHNTSNLQLMTIHKSKGLEFDYVILPELHDKGQFDTANILAWHEQPTNHHNIEHQYDWLLAPKKAIGDETDKMYQLIRKINQDKSYYETTRVFYVAVTRAKKGLHLCYQNLAENKNMPPKDSLLYSVWNKHLTLNCEYIHYQAPAEQVSHHQQYTYAVLPPEWQISQEVKIPLTHSDTSNSNYVFDYTWNIEQKVGSVYHLVLKLLSENNHLMTDLNLLATKINYFLHTLIVPSEAHAKYSQEILSTLKQIVTSKKGKWLLQNHKDAHSEYPVSLVQGQEIKHYIIDRTFIDENNIRWIIDYKTSMMTDNDIHVFLKKEWEKYHQQLQTYAKFFARIEKNAIKLALYYPRQQLWFEEDYSKDALCLLS